MPNLVRYHLVYQKNMVICSFLKMLMFFFVIKYSLVVVVQLGKTKKTGAEKGESSVITPPRLDNS